MIGHDFVDALAGIDSATVANAVESLHVRDRTEGYADLRLRCLVSQGAPMVGYAVTVVIDSTTPNQEPDSSRLADLIAAVSQSPKPCVVVCAEAGPRPERGCHMGDVVATRLVECGVVGVVSGSGVRDLPGVRELGLTVFALGTVVGRGAWTITTVGVDVEVAGLHVRTGDLLHGDGDGLVSVPSSRPEELLQQIAAVRAKEVHARQHGYSDV